MTRDKQIITLSKINGYRKFLGSKTLQLKKCIEWGFNVPNFIALPSNISAELFADKAMRDSVTQQITQHLPAKKYAVRSSALIEDSQESSFAGQFSTQLDVGPGNLSESIYEVLKQAHAFLNGDLQSFSIIVQEYIDPEIAGVTFTRNPNGSREMIVEYGAVVGEQIVGGSVTPEKFVCYWNEKTLSKLPKVLLRNDITGQCKMLEEKNNFPQDVEWCVSGDNFYILQTRPITTITDQIYNQIKYLEDFLQKKEIYYFAKTEISEIAPRPTLITLDLLKMIYAEDGPVASVYRKYGVRYTDTNFLVVIGNELYVDKEKEIQSLLPSYSYFLNKANLPKIGIDSKIFITLKNSFNLNKIKTGIFKELFGRLKKKLAQESDSQSIKEAIDRFLKDYQLIFEINLLSGLAMKKVEVLLKKEPINMLDIVAGGFSLANADEYNISCPKKLSGNSLELSDDSKFLSREISVSEINKNFDSWWKDLPNYKQSLFRNTLVEVAIFNRLREYGRWLTVKNINRLRDRLLEYAVQKMIKNREDIFFCSLTDSVHGTIRQDQIEKSKAEYEKYKDFNLPSMIRSAYVTMEEETQGVSAGVAQGVLLEADSIAQVSGEEKIILYTEILSPDLTAYFDKISGIVSYRGGLLSHLAIMARENNIPVVVGFSMTESDIKVGEVVSINGSSGKIARVDET